MLKSEFLSFTQWLWCDSLILHFIHLAFACPWGLFVSVLIRSWQVTLPLRAKGCFTSDFFLSQMQQGCQEGDDGPSLLWFSFSIASCDHSGAGRLLFVSSNCVWDNKCFWQKPYLKGCVSEKTQEWLVTSLIILQTVLFMELLWEILLVVIDYLTHVWFLNAYPGLKQC